MSTAVKAPTIDGWSVETLYKTLRSGEIVFDVFEATKRFEYPSGHIKIARARDAAGLRKVTAATDNEVDLRQQGERRQRLSEAATAASDTPPEFTPDEIAAEQKRLAEEQNA
jgi:hypothetical protein